MSNTNQAGKGSRPRPVKYSAFSKNWDAINWHHNKKDKQNGKSKPENRRIHASTEGTGETDSQRGTSNRSFQQNS